MTRPDETARGPSTVNEWRLLCIEIGIYGAAEISQISEESFFKRRLARACALCSIGAQWRFL